MQSVEITLVGSIPPKKNNRVTTRSGASIPNKAFYEWQADAIKQVRIQTRARFFGRVRIDFLLYFGTLRIADCDNVISSIQDMLREAMIIKDDNYLDLPGGSWWAEYRKGEPGAVVKITEL